MGRRNFFSTTTSFTLEGSAQLSHGVSRNSDGAYVTAPGFGDSKNTVFDSNLYYGKLEAPNDPHALTSDPLCRSPGRGSVGRQSLSGYFLRPGSPAVNSGIRIADATFDFYGTPVHSCGGVDRGAFESDTCTKDPPKATGVSEVRRLFTAHGYAKTVGCCTS